MSYVNTSKQFFANTLLGKSFLKKNPINLLLIGARDGLSRPWSEFNESCIHAIGFEPDYKEYEKLINVRKRNRTYFPNAVWIKKETRPFRKMGHVTICNSDIEEAKRLAKTISKVLKVVSE